MHRRPFVTLAAAGLTLAALGCSAADLLDIKRDDPAFIISVHDSASIWVADPVGRGTPFDVKFMTSGGSCTESGRNDVTISDGRVEIHAYDRNGSIGCGGDVLRMFIHTVPIQINSAGSVTIHVIGREHSASTGVDAPIEFVRTITVR